MLSRIAILSPHRDDSLFSLGISLWKWSTAAPIEVTNFFTVSAYAPRLATESPTVISEVRRREDRHAFSKLSRSIKSVSLDLLDAPLRLGIDIGAICQTGMASRIDPGLVANLAGRIRRLSMSGLVLAPLALGNHVDHVAVHRAATSGSRPRKLGFYEDLPYAIWTAEHLIQNTVRTVEESTGIALRPVIIRSPKAVAVKRRLAILYQSQINPSEADAIARYAEKYNGGERVWIPRHGKAWHFLTRGHHL